MRSWCKLWAIVPLHLGGDYYAAQQFPANRDVSSPWALLVNVGTLLRFQGCLEAKTDRLEEADKPKRC